MTCKQVVDMVSKFLICKTKESAEKLRAMGFEEIPSGAVGTFAFLNKASNEASFEASNDIAYTDVLSL